MDWLHYNFTANGTSELKAWRVKNFVCCSSHNKRFNYPVFAVYKRHVTVALKIIISLWTGVERQRERVTPCLDLVAVCSPNLLAVDIFVRLWGAPTEQLFFFSPKYHNTFPENKISHPKVLCIIYWLWIKRFWLQSQSQISKSCLSVGRYQILYLCGALGIMGTVITHKQ